jgi:hypothetical protein
MVTAVSQYDVRQAVFRRRDALGRHLAYGVVRYAMREAGCAIPVACPCCGYLTVSDDRFDVCGLCLWCDDGQDDPDADTVRHGPNRGLSLTAARMLFHKTLFAFSSEHELYAKEQGFRPDKVAIIQIFDRMIGAVSSDEAAELFVSAEMAMRKLFEKRESMMPRR